MVDGHRAGVGEQADGGRCARAVECRLTTTTGVDIEASRGEKVARCRKDPLWQNERAGGDLLGNGGTGYNYGPAKNPPNDPLTLRKYDPIVPQARRVPGGPMRTRQLTGVKPVFGNNVSHSHRRTRRRWSPNIQNRRYWLPSEDLVRPAHPQHPRHQDGADKIGVEAAVARIRARGEKV